MKKPTLEEVKEYFKDAETVKSTSWSKDIIPYKDNIRKGVHYWGGGVWIDSEKDTREIWDSTKGFAEIITYKNTKQMKTLTREDYKRIHDIACGGTNGWKNKLQDWYGNKFAIEDEINIKDSEYKLMRKACTPEQNDLFDEIFGKDQKEIEEGKPYKRNDGYLVFITKYDKRRNRVQGYGFNRNGDYKRNLDYNASRFTEATEEEWKAALIKEAENKGFKEGVKVQSLTTNEHKFTLTNFWHIDSEGALWFQGSDKNGVIFKHGKWAEIIKEQPEKTYKIGQRFKHNGDKYILSKIDNNDGVNFICLKDGILWDEGVKVENIYNITQKELNEIKDTFEFTLYKE